MPVDPKLINFRINKSIIADKHINLRQHIQAKFTQSITELITDTSLSQKSADIDLKFFYMTKIRLYNIIFAFPRIKSYGISSVSDEKAIATMLHFLHLG